MTIDTNTVCNGNHAIFTSAYLGSFDPNNLCSNWAGDVGSDPNPEGSFQVNVPAGETLIVVVNEEHHSGCPGYELTITGLCPTQSTHAERNTLLHTRRRHAGAVDAGSASSGRSLRRVHG